MPVASPLLSIATPAERRQRRRERRRYVGDSDGSSRSSRGGLGWLSEFVSYFTSRGLRGWVMLGFLMAAFAFAAYSIGRVLGPRRGGVRGVGLAGDSSAERERFREGNTGATVYGDLPSHIEDLSNSDSEFFEPQQERDYEAALARAAAGSEGDMPDAASGRADGDGAAVNAASPNQVVPSPAPDPVVTAVLGLFVPSFSKTAWPTQRSALRALAAMKPWVVGVVFTRSETVRKAAEAEGFSCVSDFATSGGDRDSPAFRDMLTELAGHVPNAAFYGVLPHNAMVHRNLVATLHTLTEGQDVAAAAGAGAGGPAGVAAPVAPHVVAVAQRCTAADAAAEAKLLEAVPGRDDMHDVAAVAGLSKALRHACSSGNLGPDDQHDLVLLSAAAVKDALTGATGNDAGPGMPAMYGSGYSVVRWLVARAAKPAKGVDNGAGTVGDVADITGTVPVLVLSIPSAKRAAGASGGGTAEDDKANAAALKRAGAEHVRAVAAALTSGHSRLASTFAAAGGSASAAGFAVSVQQRPGWTPAVGVPAELPPTPAEAAASASAAAVASSSSSSSDTPNLRGAASAASADSAAAHEHGSDGPDFGHHHTAHEKRKQPALVTLFVTLSPTKVGSQKYNIQLNTLKALHFMWPEVDIVVFAKEKEVRAMVEPLGIEVTGEFETNPHGTPYLRSMYQHVQHHADSYFVGYMNADILFSRHLLNTLHEVKAGIEAGRLKKRVLVVGRRVNVQFSKDFAEDHPDMLQHPKELDEAVMRLAARGQLFQTDAEDFFIITPGTFKWSEIPDFVIGRPGYDNWLVDYAFHRKNEISSIDITKTVPAVHQTGADGNKAGHKPRPDKHWNINIGNDKFDHGRTTNCQWESRYDKGSHKVFLHKRY